MYSKSTCPKGQWWERFRLSNRKSTCPGQSDGWEFRALTNTIITIIIIVNIIIVIILCLPEDRGQKQKVWEDSGAGKGSIGGVPFQTDPIHHQEGGDCERQ